MKVLIGKETPVIKIGCIELPKYDDVQRFIGNPIIMKNVEKIPLNTFEFKKEDELKISMETQAVCFEQNLAAYCIQENFVRDRKDILIGKNELQIKFCELDSSIDSIMLWVHYDRIQEHEGILDFQLINKNIKFNELHYKECAMSFKILSIVRNLDKWIVQELKECSFINYAGVCRSYGIF